MAERIVNETVTGCSDPCYLPPVAVIWQRQRHNVDNVSVIVTGKVLCISQKIRRATQADADHLTSSLYESLT